MILGRQTSSLIDASDVTTQYMQKNSNVLQENFSAKCVTNLDTSLQSVTRRTNRLQAGALYPHQDGDSNVSEESNTDELFCLQMKVQKTQLTNLQLPKPVYLMANLVYHLQMHHRQNKYLHARLDTCADVNLILVAVYQLMFKDPSLKKFTPSTLEIETYTNDVVKIIGPCQFYPLHPENKKLIKVIFFVAKKNGSVLLLCRMAIALGLIKPHA